MRIVRIEITNMSWGNPEIYHHCIGDNSNTLCGEDTVGDKDRIIKFGYGKIDCPRCIKIITECKAIKAMDISQKHL